MASGDNGWGNRFGRISRRLGLTKDQAADLLGTTVPDLEARLADPDRLPVGLVIDWSRRLGVNPGDFFTDPPVQALVVKVGDKAKAAWLEANAELYQGVPLYESGKLSAGAGGLVFDPFEEPDGTVVVYRPELQGRMEHDLKAMRIGGRSMEPSIPRGSIVVADTSDKALVEGRLYVVSQEEAGLWMGVVKRVRRTDSGLVLHSDNPDYDPIPTDLDWPDLCVGRVVWMWRSLEDA